MVDELLLVDGALTSEIYHPLSPGVDGRNAPVGLFEPARPNLDSTAFGVEPRCRRTSPDPDALQRCVLVEQTSERSVVVAEQVDHVGRRVDDEIGLPQIGGESVEVERAPGTTIYDQFFSFATVGQLKRSDKQRMVRQHRRVNPNDGNQVVGSTNKN